MTTFLVTTAIMALLLPPAAQYMAAFWILCWLVKRRRDLKTLSPETRAMIRLVAVGALAYLVTAVVSGVIASFVEGTPASWQNLWEPLPHHTLKRFVLWLVLGAGVSLAYQSGFRFQRAARPLIVYLALYAVYGLVQRSTGMDLVHGLHAVLPPNRFGYDVFRVSGFMGHPISLSYNLMVLLLIVVALFRRFGAALTRADKRDWAIVATLAAFILLLSGSRWPLIVLAVTFVLCEGRALWRFKWWILAGTAAAAAALVIEGTLLQRVGEVFQGDRSLYDRVPRLLFWNIHWAMFTDHPLQGVGYAGYDAVAQPYYVAAGFGEFRERYTAHNIFLQVLADGGLIGFAGLLTLLVTIGVGARRWALAGRPEAFSYLLVATVAGGLMQNLLRDSTYLYALWLGLAIFLAESEHGHSKPSSAAFRGPPSPV